VAEAVQRAMSDLALRQRAWRMNPEIVASRADLYQNSKVFVEKFKELAGASRNLQQLCKHQLGLNVERFEAQTGLQMRKR
jgi:hypothetical protein